MNEKLSKARVLQFALVVGASLTAMATSAMPAFADSGPRIPNVAPTAYCQPNQCDNAAGNGGDGGFTSPGVSQDGGFGRVSPNIGKGQQDYERNRPHPPVRAYGAPRRSR